MPQIQTITLRFKERAMKKKILAIIFLLIVFSTVTGCKQELIDENIMLKANVAVLEQQLKLCNGERVKSNEDLFKIHPNATNPNNNASF